MRSVLSVVVVVMLAANPAFAGPAAPKPPAAKAAGGHGKTALLAPSPSHRAAPAMSIGSPTEGRLVGGAHLLPGDHLRIVPQYANGDVRWGLEPLVGMLDRAARSVRRQFPDAVMSVGHLSRNGGGEIDRHASHESGRDADVGFYVKNHIGKPVYADHFVPFTGDGTSRSWPGAQFDDARNWALVAALVTDPQAKVTHLFVATPLRARLLAYAERIGVPHATRQRASEVMAQPRGALPHDDHFHVRIACPSGMDKCIELPVAKRTSKTHGAVAANLHGKTGGAQASARAPLAPPAKRGAPPPAKSEPRPAAKPHDDEASAKSESLVPSLAPIVPGLDSAVIAAPLGNVPRDTPHETPKPEDQPAVRPVDDPDGVLE